MPTIISKPIPLIWFIPTSPWTRSLPISRFLQLRILLYQLLQTEARKLYRNLGVFPVPFALIHRPFPIFRVLDLLPGTESPPAFRLLRHHFRNMELLTPRRKKFRNVVDGVVVRERSRCLRLDPGRVPGGTLVFVFVGVVRALPVWRGHSCPRTASRRRECRRGDGCRGSPFPRSAQLLHQLRRHLFQKSRWHTR